MPELQVTAIDGIATPKAGEKYGKSFYPKLRMLARSWIQANGGNIGPDGVTTNASALSVLVQGGGEVTINENLDLNETDYKITKYNDIKPFLEGVEKYLNQTAFHAGGDERNYIHAKIRESLVAHANKGDKRGLNPFSYTLSTAADLDTQWKEDKANYLKLFTKNPTRYYPEPEDVDLHIFGSALKCKFCVIGNQPEGMMLRNSVYAGGNRVAVHANPFSGAATDPCIFLEEHKTRYFSFKANTGFTLPNTSINTLLHPDLLKATYEQLAVEKIGENLFADATTTIPVDWQSKLQNPAIDLNLYLDDATTGTKEEKIETVRTQFLEAKLKVLTKTLLEELNNFVVSGAKTGSIKDWNDVAKALGITAPTLLTTIAADKGIQTLITNQVKVAYTAANQPALLVVNNVRPQVNVKLASDTSLNYANKALRRLSYALMSQYIDGLVGPDGKTTIDTDLFGANIKEGTDLAWEVKPLLSVVELYLNGIMNKDEQDYVHQQINESLLIQGKPKRTTWEEAKSHYLAIYGKDNLRASYPEPNAYDVTIFAQAMHCNVAFIDSNAEKKGIADNVVAGLRGNNIGLKIYGDQYNKFTDPCIYFHNGQLLSPTADGKAPNIDVGHVTNALLMTENVENQLKNSTKLLGQHAVGMHLFKDPLDSTTGPTVIASWKTKYKGSAFDFGRYLTEKKTKGTLDKALPKWREAYLENRLKTYSYAELMEISQLIKEAEASKDYTKVVGRLHGSQDADIIAAIAKDNSLQVMIANELTKVFAARDRYLEPIRSLLGNNSDFEKMADQALMNGWDPESVTTVDDHGRTVGVNFMQKIAEIFTTQDPDEELTWTEWLAGVKDKAKENKDTLGDALIELGMNRYTDLNLLSLKNKPDLNVKPWKQRLKMVKSPLNREFGWAAELAMKTQEERKVFGEMQNFALAYIWQKAPDTGLKPLPNATVMPDIKRLNNLDWSTNYKDDTANNERLSKDIAIAFGITDATKQTAFAKYLMNPMPGTGETRLSFVRSNQQYSRQISALPIPEKLKDILMARAPLDTSELGRLVKLFDSANLFNIDELNNLNESYRIRTGNVNAVPILTPAEYSSMLTADIQQMLGLNKQLSHDPNMFRDDYNVTSGIDQKKDSYGYTGTGIGGALGLGSALSAQFAAIPMASHWFGMLTGAVGGAFSAGTLAVPSYVAGAAIMTGGIGLLGYLTGRQFHETTHKTITNNWGERDMLEELENAFDNPSVKDEDGRIFKLAEEMGPQVASALEYISNCVKALSAGGDLKAQLTVIRSRLKDALNNPHLDAETKKTLKNLRAEIKDFLKVPMLGGQSEAQKLATNLLQPLEAMQLKLSKINDNIQKVLAQEADVLVWNAKHNRFVEGKLSKDNVTYQDLDNLTKLTGTAFSTREERKKIIQDEVVRVPKKYSITQEADHSKSTAIESVITPSKGRHVAATIASGKKNIDIFIEDKKGLCFTEISTVSAKAKTAGYVTSAKEAIDYTFQTKRSIDGDTISISRCSTTTVAGKQVFKDYEDFKDPEVIAGVENRSSSRAALAELTFEKLGELIETCIDKYGMLPNAQRPLVIYPENDLAIKQVLAYREILKGVFPGMITDASFKIMGLTTEKTKELDIVASYTSGRRGWGESYLGRPPYFNKDLCSSNMQKIVNAMNYEVTKDKNGVVTVSGPLADNIQSLKNAMSLACVRDMGSRVMKSAELSRKTNAAAVSNVQKSAILNASDVINAVNDAKNPIGTQSITKLTSVANTPATPATLLADAARFAKEAEDAETAAKVQAVLINDTGVTGFNTVVNARQTTSNALDAVDATKVANLNRAIQNNIKEVNDQVASASKELNEPVNGILAKQIQDVTKLDMSAWDRTNPTPAAGVRDLELKRLREKEGNPRKTLVTTKIGKLETARAAAEMALNKLLAQSVDVNIQLTNAKQLEKEAQAAHAGAVTALSVIAANMAVANNAMSKAKQAYDDMVAKFTTDSLYTANCLTMQNAYDKAKKHHDDLVALHTTTENTVKAMKITADAVTANVATIQLIVTQLDGTDIPAAKTKYAEAVQAKTNAGDVLRIIDLQISGDPEGLAMEAAKQAEARALALTNKAKEAEDAAALVVSKLPALKIAPKTSSTATAATLGETLNAASTEVTTLLGKVSTKTDSVKTKLTATASLTTIADALAIVNNPTDNVLTNLEALVKNAAAVKTAQDNLDVELANVENQIKAVNDAIDAIGSGSGDNKLHHQAKNAHSSANVAKTAVTSWKGTSTDARLNVVNQSIVDAITKANSAKTMAGIGAATGLQADATALRTRLNAADNTNPAHKANEEALKELNTMRVSLLQMAQAFEAEKAALATTGAKSETKECQAAKDALKNATDAVEALKIALESAESASQITTAEKNRILAEANLKIEPLQRTYTSLAAKHAARIDALSKIDSTPVDISTAITTFLNKPFTDKDVLITQLAEMKTRAEQLTKISIALNAANTAFKDVSEIVTNATTPTGAAAIAATYSTAQIQKIVIAAEKSSINFPMLCGEINVLKDQIKKGYLKSLAYETVLQTVTAQMDTAINLYKAAKDIKTQTEQDLQILISGGKAKPEELTAAYKKVADAAAKMVELRKGAEKAIKACQTAHKTLIDAWTELAKKAEKVTRVYPSDPGVMDRTSEGIAVHGIYARIKNTALDKATAISAQTNFITANFTDTAATDVKIVGETSDTSLADAKAAAKAYTAALIKELEAKRDAAKAQIVAMQTAVDAVDSDNKTLSKRIEDAKADSATPLDTKATDLCAIALTALTTATATHQKAATDLDVEAKYNAAINAINVIDAEFALTASSITTSAQLESSIMQIAVLSGKYNTDVILKCAEHHANFNKEMKVAATKLLEGNIEHQRFLMNNAVNSATAHVTKAKEALDLATTLNKKVPLVTSTKYTEIADIGVQKVEWTDPATGNVNGKKTHDEILTDARAALISVTILPALAVGMAEAAALAQQTHAEAVHKALDVQKQAFKTAKDNAKTLAGEIQQSIFDITTHFNTAKKAKVDSEEIIAVTFNAIKNKLNILKNEAVTIKGSEVNRELEALITLCGTLVTAISAKGTAEKEVNTKIGLITQHETAIQIFIDQLGILKNKVDAAALTATNQEVEADKLIQAYKNRENEAKICATKKPDERATAIVAYVETLVKAAELKKQDVETRAAEIEGAKVLYDAAVKGLPNNLTQWNRQAEPITTTSAAVLGYNFTANYDDAQKASDTTTLALTAAVELFKLVTTMQGNETTANENKQKVDKAATLVTDIAQLEKDLQAIDLKIIEAEGIIQTAAIDPRYVTDIAFKKAVDDALVKLGQNDTQGLRKQRIDTKEAIFSKRNSGADASVKEAIDTINAAPAPAASTLTSANALINAQTAAATVRLMCDKTLEGLLKKATVLNTQAIGLIDVTKVSAQITELKNNEAVKNAIATTTLTMNWTQAEQDLLAVGVLLKDVFLNAVTKVTNIQKALAVTTKKQEDVKGLQTQLNEAITATKDLEAKLLELKGVVKKITDEIGKAHTVAETARWAAEAEAKKKEQDALDLLATNMKTTYTDQYATKVTTVLGEIMTALKTGYASTDRTADLDSSSNTPIEAIVAKFIKHQADVEAKVGDKTTPDNVTAKLAGVVTTINEELAKCNEIISKIGSGTANGENKAFFEIRQGALNTAKTTAAAHITNYQNTLLKDRIEVELRLREKLGTVLKSQSSSADNVITNIINKYNPPVAVPKSSGFSFGKTAVTPVETLASNVAAWRTTTPTTLDEITNKNATKDILADLAEIQCRVALLAANEEIRTLNALTGKTQTIADIIVKAVAAKNAVELKTKDSVDSADKTQQVLLTDQLSAEAGKVSSVLKEVETAVNDANVALDNKDIDTKLATLQTNLMKLDSVTDISNQITALDTYLNDVNSLGLAAEITEYKDAINAKLSTGTPFKALQELYQQAKSQYETLEAGASKTALEGLVNQLAADRLKIVGDATDANPGYLKAITDAEAAVSAVYQAVTKAKTAGITALNEATTKELKIRAEIQTKAIALYGEQIKAAVSTSANAAEDTEKAQEALIIYLDTAINGNLDRINAALLKIKELDQNITTANAANPKKDTVWLQAQRDNQMTIVLAAIKNIDIAQRKLSEPEIANRRDTSASVADTRQVTLLTLAQIVNYDASVKGISSADWPATKLREDADIKNNVSIYCKTPVLVTGVPAKSVTPPLSSAISDYFVDAVLNKVTQIFKDSNFSLAVKYVVTNTKKTGDSIEVWQAEKKIGGYSERTASRILVEKWLMQLKAVIELDDACVDAKNKKSPLLTQLALKKQLHEVAEAFQKLYGDDKRTMQMMGKASPLTAVAIMDGGKVIVSGVVNRLLKDAKETAKNIITEKNKVLKAAENIQIALTTAKLTSTKVDTALILVPADNETLDAMVSAAESDITTSTKAVQTAAENIVDTVKNNINNLYTQLQAALNARSPVDEISQNILTQMLVLESLQTHSKDVPEFASLNKKATEIILSLVTAKQLAMMNKDAPAINTSSISGSGLNNDDTIKKPPTPTNSSRLPLFDFSKVLKQLQELNGIIIDVCDQTVDDVSLDPDAEELEDKLEAAKRIISDEIVALKKGIFAAGEVLKDTATMRKLNVLQSERKVIAANLNTLRVLSEKLKDLDTGLCTQATEAIAECGTARELAITNVKSTVNKYLLWGKGVKAAAQDLVEQSVAFESLLKDNCEDNTYSQNLIEKYKNIPFSDETLKQISNMVGKKITPDENATGHTTSFNQAAVVIETSTNIDEEMQKRICTLLNKDLMLQMLNKLKKTFESKIKDKSVVLANATDGSHSKETCENVLAKILLDANVSQDEWLTQANLKELCTAISQLPERILPGKNDLIKEGNSFALQALELCSNEGVILDTPIEDEVKTAFATNFPTASYGMG